MSQWPPFILIDMPEERAAAGRVLGLGILMDAFWFTGSIFQFRTSELLSGFLLGAIFGLTMGNTFTGPSGHYQ